MREDKTASDRSALAAVSSDIESQQLKDDSCSRPRFDYRAQLNHSAISFSTDPDAG